MLLGHHAEHARGGLVLERQVLLPLGLHTDPPVIQTPSDLSPHFPETKVFVYRLSKLLKFNL